MVIKYTVREVEIDIKLSKNNKKKNCSVKDFNLILNAFGSKGKLFFFAMWGWLAFFSLLLLVLLLLLLQRFLLPLMQKVHFPHNLITVNWSNVGVEKALQ